jgi:hypothetical protein
MSAMPLTAGKVFPYVYAGSRYHEGLGVMASLDGDATWNLLFPLPPFDPGGTLKLVIGSIANAGGTQSAYLRILWAAVAAAEEPDDIGLNDEHSGGDLEIEHTAAGADDLIVTKVTLDADTITYGTDQWIVLNVDLKTASWDLAVIWTFWPYLIWE